MSMKLQTILILLLQVISGQKLPAMSLNNLLMVGPKAYQSYSESVAIGAHRGLEECRYQFQWDRWNCPLGTAPIFSQSWFSEVTQETSFVQAITSAGVAFTLTQNCSVGQLDNCQCDDNKKGTNGGPTWQWGGCSDNVRFGERIAKLFVDSMETSKDARALTTLHNNEAGRRAVRKSMILMCKCHGVSGSCTTKTCWKQLPEFRTVGNRLKKRYSRAHKVNFQNGALQQTTGRNRRNKRERGLKSTDLAFIDRSPDYCTVNGTKATLGRQCSRPNEDDATRLERRSCDKLCKSCGLRVRKRLLQEEKSCNCKFHWCCEVKCETCEQKTEKLTCSLL